METRVAGKAPSHADSQSVAELNATEGRGLVFVLHRLPER